MHPKQVRNIRCGHKEEAMFPGLATTRSQTKSLFIQFPWQTTDIGRGRTLTKKGRSALERPFFLYF